MPDYLLERHKAGIAPHRIAVENMFRANRSAAQQALESAIVLDEQGIDQLKIHNVMRSVSDVCHGARRACESIAVHRLAVYAERP